ncbi:Tfp pilus assembly protein FimT/FimU [Lewinella sp. LCG006]|uniref:pilus assembly FimT family protein n=1 Tax=Lewinella sp. LCG006 TaxID=3231911 RepID=UPI00346088A7
MARLKGSSLIEATTALAILTIALGTAWFCFGQLLTNNRTLQEFHAALLLRQRATQIEQEDLWYASSWDTLGYNITQTVEPLNNDQSLYKLMLRCETPDQRIFYYETLKKRAE